MSSRFEMYQAEDYRVSRRGAQARAHEDGIDRRARKLQDRLTRNSLRRIRRTFPEGLNVVEDITIYETGEPVSSQEYLGKVIPLAVPIIKQDVDLSLAAESNMSTVDRSTTGEPEEAIISKALRMEREGKPGGPFARVLKFVRREAVGELILANRS